MGLARVTARIIILQRRVHHISIVHEGPDCVLANGIQTRHDEQDRQFVGF